MPFGMVSHLVGFEDTEPWVDGGVDLGPQRVSDPTNVHLPHTGHPGDTDDGGGGLVDEGRVDRVE